MISTISLKERVLATDLDNTIVGLGSHADLWESLPLEKTSLIYITGRYKQSALQLICDEHLPRPDILICDVGASIYRGDDFALDLTWHERAMISNSEQILKLAKDVHLEKQPIPIESMTRFAYYATPAQFQAFKRALNDYELDVDAIYSSDRDVDIVAKGVHKGAALTYVLEKLQYKGDVVVAGDSENDLSLFQLGFPAIAVGNACRAIKDLATAPHIHEATKPAAQGVAQIWKRLFFKA